jgi:hypothetical protein
MRTTDLDKMSDEEFKAAARNDCQVATYASTIYDYLLEALRRLGEVQRQLEEIRSAQKRGGQKR